MRNPLRAYMEDHLAGSAYAIDLSEFIRDNYEGQEVGQFAARLLAEIEADREVLNDSRDGLARRKSQPAETGTHCRRWLGSI
jgi:hypothetical protein